MMPPTITTPATIPNFFITFLSKNSVLSGGVSVGGEKDKRGDSSDVKWCDCANPSGINGTDPSNAEK
jgi:hypothetical protein